MFKALSDPSRRRLLDRLFTENGQTLSSLCEELDMSRQAITQHLQVLEASGLVRSEKVGRVRTCQIETKALRTAEQWINERRLLWERRLDRLGAFLDETKPKE